MVKQSRREPRWLTRRMLDVIHANQLHQHGGMFGTRDEGLIESALARPGHRLRYHPESDLAYLAAAYGYGLSQNHGYVDGTKRVAFRAEYELLWLNEKRQDAPEPEVVRMMLDLAAGDLTEADLAAWIRAHLVRRT